MRLAIFTPKVRHLIVTLGDLEIPGIMVEGGGKIDSSGIIQSNFFLPVMDCNLLYFEDESFNGDQFSIVNQFGLFKGPEGGIVISPSDAFNNYALVFFEFMNVDKIVLPKHGSPEFLKRVEFEEEGDSDIFMIVLKKDINSSVFSFTKDDKILEFTFLFDYIAGQVGFKVKSVS